MNRCKGTEAAIAAYSGYNKSSTFHWEGGAFVIAPCLQPLAEQFKKRLTVLLRDRQHGDIVPLRNAGDVL